VPIHIDGSIRHDLGQDGANESMVIDVEGYA
jgi:hypothetical protein